MRESELRETRKSPAIR